MFRGVNAGEEGGRKEMSKEKNRIEILLEEIRGDVKLALEGHDVLRKEMQNIKGELQGEIREVKSAVSLLGLKLNDIDKKLDAHIKQPAHVS